MERGVVCNLTGKMFGQPGFTPEKLEIHSVPQISYHILAPHPTVTTESSFVSNVFRT